VFAFLSYRDPHLTETLDIYRGAADSVCRSPVSREELEKAVIGAIGALDRPLDPAGRGYTALIREFSDMTDPVRRRFRGEVLDITPEIIQETAQRYFTEAAGAEVVAVFAAEERLKRANEVLTTKMKLEKLA